MKLLRAQDGGTLLHWDRLRFEAHRDASREFHEWHHFVVPFGDSFCLVNLSVEWEPGKRRWIKRVLIAIPGNSAGGGYQACEVQSVAQGDKISDDQGLSVGGATLSVNGGRYWLRYQDAQSGFELDLMLTPASEGLLSPYIPLTQVRSMGWMMVPRFLVEGRVRGPCGTHTSFSGFAYHDHNWGSWGWEDRFGWDWGATLPYDGQAFSFVFGRSCASGLSGAYLYEDGRPIAVFRDHEVTFEPSGDATIRVEQWIPPVACHLDLPIRDVATKATVRAFAAPGFSAYADLVGLDGRCSVEWSFQVGAALGVLIPVSAKVMKDRVILELFGTSCLRITRASQVFEQSGPCIFERTFSV